MTSATDSPARTLATGLKPSRVGSNSHANVIATGQPSRTSVTDKGTSQPGPA